MGKKWEVMESYFGEKFDKFLSHIRTILVKKKATAELLKALELNINDFERIINLDVYGKRFVRYLILKLDLLYRGNSVQFNPPVTISIEHILPQNPSAGSGWMNDFTEEERYEWTNDMNKKTEESRIAYNKIAAEYDMSREGQYTRFHIMELSNTVDLSAGNVVLDVACGNGTLLRELSKKAEIQANGIDISENMIYSAKMRYPNMNFEVKPCYPLEWSDESIDIITVCCAFHHFDNPQGFVSECKRVLKKNGTVYMAGPNFGVVVRFIANNFWFPFSKSGDVKIYSKKELEQIFYNCGFKTVHIYRKGTGVFLKAKK